MGGLSARVRWDRAGCPTAPPGQKCGCALGALHTCIRLGALVPACSLRCMTLEALPPAEIPSARLCCFAQCCAGRVLLLCMLVHRLGRHPCCPHA